MGVLTEWFAAGYDETGAGSIADFEFSAERL